MPVNPPTDRYCDIVMKGGITSGVVYPPAICKLAEHYHFKNIGGTSAGAIAAALTAAAEYRRRQTGSNEGFDQLSKLPVSLGEVQSGGTQLFRLFQADASASRLFRILTGSLNATGTYDRIRKVLFSCMSSYWIASLASIVLSVGLGYYLQTWHAGILLFLITQPFFVGTFIYRDATRGLANNNYGMCKGMTTRGELGPALTPWLHAQIQRAAGLPESEPLTFGHLWAARGGPQPTGNTAVRSIDLEMFTTNLSHGRPYMLPHVEKTARLFYRHDDLAPYLPDDVMRWFDGHAVDYVADPHSDPPVKDAIALGLKEIPKPEHFPVLLAARMSLSFPVLFAAIPLWAIDYQHPKEGRTFQRCLFSDGGISSNFPMHLFDGLVPQWPTFGIDLEPAVPDLDQPVFLPKTYLGGIADRWTRFDGLPKAASRMGGFLMSIASAMQNWNDNTQARSAGVRDRIVRVRLKADEGGMNLNMPANVINAVALKGGMAADEIIGRFLGPPNPGPPVPPGAANGHLNGWDGWSSQRWDRLDVLMYALSQKAGGLKRALGDLPHAVSYQQLIRMGANSKPPGHDEPLTSEQVAAVSALTAALDEVASAFQDSSNGYSNHPQPEPELRARSVL